VALPESAQSIGQLAGRGQATLGLAVGGQ